MKSALHTEGRNLSSVACRARRAAVVQDGDRALSLDADAGAMEGFLWAVEKLEPPPHASQCVGGFFNLVHVDWLPGLGLLGGGRLAPGVGGFGARAAAALLANMLHDTSGTPPALGCLALTR
jgi:hypothetical protein